MYRTRDSLVFAHLAPRLIPNWNIISAHHKYNAACIFSAADRLSRPRRLRGDTEDPDDARVCDWGHGSSHRNARTSNDFQSRMVRPSLSNTTTIHVHVGVQNTAVHSVHAVLTDLDSSLCHRTNRPVNDGFTGKFKVFCRPPQTRNNNIVFFYTDWHETFATLLRHTRMRTPYIIYVPQGRVHKNRVVGS